MQPRHQNKIQYFKEQSITTEKYVIPYVAEFVSPGPDMTVMEIGCAEGGNLKPFLDAGCRVIGIDISVTRIQKAREFLDDHPNINHLTLIDKDVYLVDFSQLPPIDLIFLRDTIEHIPDQLKIISFFGSILKPGGKVFMAYPPWCMPFGGHQQICQNRFLSKLPYFHLFPKPIFKWILKMFKEPKQVIDNLMEIKETGLSLQRLKKYFRKAGCRIEKETYYFLNPNYEVKFKIKPKKLLFFKHIPYFRDFLTTAYYCVVSCKKG
jgi:SAM-dependent methyltransferase